MHKKCFAELAKISGIPMAKCTMELVKCNLSGVHKKGEITEQADGLDILSHRLVACKECSKITPTQILKMENGVKKIEENKENNGSLDILFDFIHDLNSNDLVFQSTGTKNNENMTVE
jgi:hypothetical protein